MYADDVEASLSSPNFESCLLLESDMFLLTEWCKVFGMSLNIKKCKSMFCRSAEYAPLITILSIP